VEQAKRPLLIPHLRVSEIAYAVGFQSFDDFNRMFRQLTGESPTRFRDKVTSRGKSTSRAT
jgi:AraC-like DNA-binding protein